VEGDVGVGVDELEIRARGGEEASADKVARELGRVEEGT